MALHARPRILHGCVRFPAQAAFQGQAPGEAPTVRGEQIQDRASGDPNNSLGSMGSALACIHDLQILYSLGERRPGMRALGWIVAVVVGSFATYVLIKSVPDIQRFTRLNRM